MKKPIITSIGLLIAIALLGLFMIMIMNHPKETPLETNTPDSIESTGNGLNSPSVEVEDENTEHFNDDHEHDHSVEIEGSEIKQLTIQQIADLWQIDSEELLNRIIQEFDFKKNYTTETSLEEMRNEYKFSPAIIKDIAEEIKQER
ncbi:hypothetical protein GQ568_01705 [Patescibacteria group bacterium]|nr:hypothetical protein [Patescibacteria group bacterium]